MLTVHHLGKSQSERIVWLCEELGIPYDLKRYERFPSPCSRRRNTRRSILSAPRR